MSNVLVQESSLQAIASAIRNKTGGNDTYKPGEMATAIRNLPGGATLQSLSVTENGTYTPSSGVDGYSSVNVAVPGGFSASDEGKVVQNGALIPQTSLSVSENGTYDTTEKNSVVVNVHESNPFNGLNNYIQSSGTQWINTGYYPTPSTRIETVVNLSGTNSYGFSALFGVEGPSTDQIFMLMDRFIPRGRNSIIGLFPAIFHGTRAINILYDPNNNDITTELNPLFFNIKTFFRMQAGHFEAQNENGDTYLLPMITNSGAAACQIPMWIFDCNYQGSHNSLIGYCIAKLYSFRIYESGTLVMELLPHQENGVVCLRDTVSGNLFYNQGTGSFTFGTDN